VWGLCFLSHLLLVYHFATPWPWCDEWELTPAAVGQQPLTLEWLWQPANEHRAPLTRLEVLLVGQLGSWDLRAVLFTNMVFLGLGGLALVLAARRIRGQTAWSDVFLAMLVLSPGQWASTVFYSYAYAMALAWFCLALAAVAVAWPLRSLAHLTLYFLILLAVTLSGGPAGNLWALGLCGVLLLDLPVCRASPAWRIYGGLGALTIAGISLAMLGLVPASPAGNHFHADTLATLVRATATLWVCWLGLPVLVLGYWALLMVGVPWAVLLGRSAWGLLWGNKGRSAPGVGQPVWRDLLPVLLVTLAVGVAIGYGRGRYPNLLDSRYHTLMMPVGLTTYLLLVRKGARIAPQFLALGMALCLGWNWPEAIGWPKGHHARAEEFTREIQASQKSLSELAVRHGEAVGYGYPAPLLRFLLQMRQAHLGAFQTDQSDHPPSPEIWAQAWEAEAGQSRGGLRVVDDAAASQGKALSLPPDKQGTGVVRFEVEVPTSGPYLLWGGWSLPLAIPPVSVQVDGGPALSWDIACGAEYHACVLSQPLTLSAGKHHLTLHVQGVSARLDKVEMMTFVK
jgi:hypothetical protein